ncbi:MAG: TlyA family RNA methyltransferase [Thermodesulfobacteriota bacterium]
MTLVPAKKAKKIRLDEAVFSRGLAGSIREARALIMSGIVSVKGRMVDKAGHVVAPDALITLKERPPYVGRGGLKLAGLLDATGFSPEGLTAMDVGSSTGGFTDCLLKRGAALVHAVDVGVGIIDWGLRSDIRVHLLEGCNIRRLDPVEVGAPIDMAVMDLSFISLKKVLPLMKGFVKTGGRVFALIKPQFEAPRKDVAKGGVVRDPGVRKMVVEDIKAFALTAGFRVLGTVESPIKGAKGNREFWIDLEVI